MTRIVALGQSPITNLFITFSRYSLVTTFPFIFPVSFFHDSIFINAAKCQIGLHVLELNSPPHPFPFKQTHSNEGTVALVPSSTITKHVEPL